MRLNEEVASVEETPGGGVVANLKSNKRISGDALLYAVGRQGNVDELNLAAAGLEADKPRPHRGRRQLSHQGAQHLRGRRRDRLSQPGFGFDGAGPHRRGAPFGLKMHSNPPLTRTASTPSPRFRSSARPKSN
jgi:hypothetical protein